MNKFNFELFLKDNGFDQLDYFTPEEQSHLLSSKFNCFTKKTSECILITCWIYYEAIRRLGVLSEFHDYTGIDPVKHESQIKKYRVIGKNFHKLIIFTDHLPNHWSTLYKLATLDQDEIQLLIDANVLNKNATCDQIFGKKKKRKSSSTKIRTGIVIEIEIKKGISCKNYQEVSKTLSAWNKSGFIKFTGDISFCDDYDGDSELPNNEERLAA